MARVTDDTLISLLQKKRNEINNQVEKARQFFPAFDLDAVNHGIIHVIEPLIKAIKTIRPDKVEAVFNVIFELLLLAVGKNYYDLPEKQFTSVRLELLFEELLPLFPEIIAEKPTNFIGKLVNAGENLREKSFEFFKILKDVSEYINGDNFTEIGQVVAWVVGETRLRESALKILEKAPPGLSLKLAGLNNISKSKEKTITPYIIDVLKNNKWRSIRKPFSSEFLKLLQNNQKIPKKILDTEMAQSNILNDRPLILLDDVGSFIGFRGNFSSPPNLIWGSNSTIIAYTEFGEIIFITMEANGYKEKSIRPRDIRVLGFNPNFGFIGVNRKGEFINLSNFKKYSEKIKGTKKFFDNCFSISTSNYIYFIHKSKEIFRIDSENVKKFAFKGKLDNLTVSTDDRFFFVKIEKTEKKRSVYFVSELSSTGKSKNLMKIKSKGHLRVNPPFVYILDEPNKLFIYNLNENSLIKSLDLPLEIRNCSSFLINEREIYITKKYSYHIICIGSDPYLS
ncbi:MAG: hypothetical protein ACFFDN_26815 [Candidatus Hodarchaeota archaeon]